MATVCCLGLGKETGCSTCMASSLGDRAIRLSITTATAGRLLPERMLSLSVLCVSVLVAIWWRMGCSSKLPASGVPGHHEGAA